MHLLSIRLALMAGLLGGWPGRRKLARRLAFTALISESFERRRGSFQGRVGEKEKMRGI